MVETVNVHEAKTHLSRLLARVEAGERIIIARAGHPIAELTPIAHERPPRVPGHDRVVIHDNFDDRFPSSRSTRDVRVLLDTHAFLWWTSEDGRRLSGRVRDLLIDPSTDAIVSAATAWEIAIKAAISALRSKAIRRYWVPERIARYRFSALPVELAHALRAGRLPLIHRDPFDRLLVAQAQVEGIPIVTSDPSIARYAVEVIW